MTSIKKTLRETNSCFYWSQYWAISVAPSSGKLHMQQMATSSSTLQYWTIQVASDLPVTPCKDKDEELALREVIDVDIAEAKGRNTDHSRFFQSTVCCTDLTCTSLHSTSLQCSPPIVCQVSDVRCQLSGVRCQVSGIQILFLSAGASRGGYVINKATSSSFCIPTNLI